jgi:hypothetical protein
MLNLTINHNIHLTHEQRYALFNGNTVFTIGVSLPVWLKDGLTSEPAREVFCRYILKNTKKESPINILEDGYEITIPYRKPKAAKLISDGDWLKLSMKNPDALQHYYAQRVAEVSCKNLLDPIDGGGKCMIYREHNKIEYNKEELNVVHYVKIADIEELLESLY